MLGRGNLNGGQDLNFSPPSSSSPFKSNMSSLDADRSAASSPWSNSESLSSRQVEAAFAKSHDGGATLILMKLNLADLGEDGAATLASVGKQNDDEKSRIERYRFHEI